MLRINGQPWFRAFWDSDKGTGGDGGGKETGNAPGGDDGREDNPDDDGQKGGDGKEDSKGGGKSGEHKFTQADVDAIIADRLKREREKADKAAADAKRKADEDALEKNKEFEALANERKAKVEELEPKLEAETKRANDLEKVIADNVKAQLEGLKLDKPFIELLENKSPLEQLEWLNKHTKEIRKRSGGMPESPEGDTPSKTSDEEAKKLTAVTWR